MKTQRAFIVISVMLLHALFVQSAPAFALTHQDFTVMMRAIGFIGNPPSGDVTVAIIYDPSGQDSAAEARQMQSELGSGYQVGGMTLHPKLVPFSALGGMDGAPIAFIAAGTGSAQAEVAKKARAQKTLTLSLDKGCVVRGNCILYVNTANRVEIVVNKASAETSGISFKPTFMVLVTVI